MKLGDRVFGMMEYWSMRIFGNWGIRDACGLQLIAKGQGLMAKAGINGIEALW